MKVRSFAATDVGRVKPNNEDAFYAGPDSGLFVVADGVGGHAAGEVASRTAVETIVAALEPRIAKLRELVGSPAPESRRSALAILEDAVRQADRRIHEMAHEDPVYHGMATTTDVLLLTPGGALVAHVGDSRVYLIRGGLAKLLTYDHTVANSLMRRANLSADQVAGIARGNALSRAVGLGGSEIDLLSLDLQPGDRFVMCSDGLWTYVKDDTELLRLVTQGHSALSAQGFIQFANARGGRDNVTTIFVIVDDPGMTQVRLEMSRKIEVLRGTTLLAGLAEQDLLKVLPATDEISLPEGHVVVSEGEPGGELYILLEGRVEVESGGVVLATLEPGSQFGELSLVDDRPRSATVRTIEPARLLKLSREDFRALTASEIGPRLLWNLVSDIAGRLRDTSWQLSEQVKAYRGE